MLNLPVTWRGVLTTNLGHPRYTPTNLAVLIFRRMNRRWIPVIIFWALFLGSIGLYGRYAWLDFGWHLALLFVLMALSIYSVIRIIRHPTEKLNTSYPRWFKRFAMDESNERSD